MSADQKTSKATNSSEIWSVPESGTDREWSPGEVALIGGGSWWKRAYILDRENDRGHYVVVSESAECLKMMHPSLLYTVESARCRQEQFRDEMIGKEFSEAMNWIDELKSAPPPKWWREFVHNWCYETVDGMGPEWMAQQFGEATMAELRKTIPAPTP